MGVLTKVLTLILAAAFLFPQFAHGDESKTVDLRHVLDFGLSDLQSEVSLHEAYDKDQLFKTTVKSFNTGQALFRINGFEIDDTESDIMENNNTVASGVEFSGLSPSLVEYKPDSIKAGDILSSIPSITTKDEKTIGLLIPPFAYFSKKF